MSESHQHSRPPARTWDSFPIRTPDSNEFTVGMVNLTFARGKMTHITDPTSGNRRGRLRWLDAHDAAILVDTKTATEHSEGYQPSLHHKAFHETTEIGNLGISIFIRKNIMVSERFATPPSMRGRALAVELKFPNTQIDVGASEITLVLVGIYAPDPSKPIAEYRIFLIKLRQWIREIKLTANRAHTQFIISGDFNAILNSQRDSFNPVRAPNVYSQDLIFQDWKREMDLYDPIDTIGSNAGARHSWTFRTNVNKEDPLDFTHRRIDYFLSTAHRAISELIIDPWYIFPHSGMDPDFYDHNSIKSDHRPITLKINLGELEAYLPDRHVETTRKVTKYPQMGEPNYNKLGIHLGEISRGGAKDITSINSNADPLTKEMITFPDSDWSSLSPQALENKVTCLHSLLSERIPGPFKKDTGCYGNRLGKNEKHLRKQITRVNRQLNAVEILMDHYYTNPTNGQYLNRRCKLAHARVVRKTQGIAIPTFSHSHFNAQDHRYTNWKASAYTHRDTLYDRFAQAVASEANKRKNVWLNKYKVEAKLGSKALRTMVFPRIQEGGPTISVKTTDGRILTQKDDVTKEYRSFFENLGTNTNSTPANVRRERLNEFISDEARYRDIRIAIKSRSMEITKIASMKELVDTVTSTEKKACNPLDGVEVATLKLVFGYTPKADDGTGEDTDIRLGLQSTILNLVNMILSTGKFPNSEKTGVIVTLYKKGDPQDLNNYRGITLLSSIYKLVTKILNKRMSRICDASKALSDLQAAGRANRGCLTQISTLLNIIKHSHRNKTPCYMISTDIRKAFDTISYDSFLQSLDILGYEDNVINLIDNLQKDFKCVVRTPYGNTDSFHIQQGCKQGCALSPLRFILVYDIFLKYIEAQKYGYKWKAFSTATTEEESKLVITDGSIRIPSLAFMDDMILMSSCPFELEQMMKDFDRFLEAVGLSINAGKCHYTAINAVSQPREIRVLDHEGGSCQIPLLNECVPMEYLGYIIRVDNGNQAKTWGLHNQKIRSKMLKATDKMRKSKLRGSDAADLMNSDVISVMSYFCAANSMPINKRSTRRTVGGDSEGVSRISSTPYLNEFKRLIYQAGYRKMKFLPNTPRATIFNTSRGLGFGILHPEALYDTAKIDNVLNCLNSPVTVCRFLMRDTLAEISARYGWDPLDPARNGTPIPSVHGFGECFPLFLLEIGKALDKSKASINLNFLDRPMGDLHPLNFIMVPKSYRKKWYREFKEKGVSSMKDLFPEWFTNGNGMPIPYGNSKLCDIFRRNDSIAGNAERGTLRELTEEIRNILSEEWRDSIDIARYCALAVRHNAVKSLPSRGFSFEGRSSYSPLHPYWASVYNGNPGRNRKSATDGSYKDGVAGLGVYSVDKQISSGIPGKQGIDRAEAFGVLADILTAGGWGDKEVVIDSQSTIQSITTLKEGGDLVEPRTYKRMANFSIIKTISDWVCENETRGYTTTLTKVRSHTGAQDENSLMNEGADSEAENGRILSAGVDSQNNIMVLRECYHNLPHAWIRIGDHILERGTHSRILETLDEYHISKAIAAAGEHQHLRYWEMHGCWKELSPTPKEAKNSPHRMFQARLFSQSLPTPRNVQVSNMKRFPKLYPNSECPLCHSGIANDHHILCRCGAVAQIRATSLRKIQQESGLATNHVKLGVSIPDRLLRRSFIPVREAEFLHGHVSNRIQDWAHSHFEQEELKKWERRLLPMFIQGYRDIWNKYTDVLADKKKNFAQRLKQEYSMTPRDLKNERIHEPNT